MQNTTKMVMVPQDAYSGLLSQQKQVYSPVVNQLANLDNELQAIISNPNIPSDIKYHQYMNAFNRYQHLQKQKFLPEMTTRNVPQISTEIQTGDDIPTADLPLDEKYLIGNLPKTVRRKGKILLDHLRNKKGLFNWLESGELIVDGKPVEGSNITDLVHYITRNRPANIPPKGAEEFEHLLNITNVPQEAMNKSTGEQSFVSPIGLGTSFAPRTASTPKDVTPHKGHKQVSKNVNRPVRNRKQTERFSNWSKF